MPMGMRFRVALVVFAALAQAAFAGWQEAIDRVAAQGGGRVTVPAGRHVTGGLVLRSNVELHLERGAVLEGSPRTNDYPVVELPCSEGRWMAVVMAVGATNVAVTGAGEIFGNGTAFPQPETYAALQEGWRPRGLFFGNCRGVRLTDFTLRDSGSWGCVVQCCREVEIRGLTIDNHANANNDGIDIEAFDAVIADCDVDASDDGVCLKSNNPDFVSGNVLVTNVTVRSHCAALKIGTATHGIVTNVTFADCRIGAPRRSFADRRAGTGKPEGASWFWSEWRAGLFPPSGPGDDLGTSAISIECVDGGWVENIVCRNITVDGTLAPIFVRGGTRTGRATGAPPGKWHILRNVLFENISGRSLSWHGNSVTGVEGCRVGDVTLRNVHLTFPGGGEAARRAVKPIPELPGTGPGTCMFDTTLPASALWARHVDGLVLDNVSIEPEPGTSDGREKYVFEDVTGRRSAVPAQTGVTLTEAGVEVVVAKDDSPVVRFAAAELTNFLSRAFGRTVRIADRPSPGGTPVFLGALAAQKAGADVSGFARDEFAVRTTPEGVAIFGRDDPRRDPEKELAGGGSMRFERGTLFGVYGFLEHDVGCRFYFPGELGEVVPRRTSVTVDGDWSAKPVFAVRRWYEGPKSVWYEGGADEPRVRARNAGLSVLRLRMETELVPCCHGQNGFRYLERFGKTHPEYFTKLSDGTRFTHPIGGHACSKFGQICLSSPVMDELYRDVKAYLTGQPASSRGLEFWRSNCAGGKYVDIMANDAFLPCRCGVCETRYSKSDPVQYATEMVWEETVRIANRLAAEGVKGYVTQMAYTPYRRIPGFDIPTNVLVMVAETGPWARGEERRRQRDEIRGWAEKLGRPVWVWTYPGKFAPQEFPGIPHQTPHAVGEFYRDVRPWIFGSFLNADSDRFLFSHLNFYMYSRIAWDPDADVDGILDEYHRLMFGPAAAELKGFFEELESLWIDRVVGNVIDTNLGPVAKPPSEDSLWREVYSPERLRAWRTSLETGFAKCPPGSLEARRVRLMAENFLGSLESQSRAYFDARAKVESLRYPSAAFPDAMRLGRFKSKGGRSAPVETSVRIVRRADDLVVTYDCAEPDLPRTRCVRIGHDHHDLWKNDGVEFHLNVSGDRKTYYQFIVTQAGELTDTRAVQDGTGGGMPEFDFGWESGAKVSVTKRRDGWTAEVVIPCASFREEPLAEFPANFCRSRVLQDDTFDLYSWSPYVLGYHDPMNFGTVSPARGSGCR